MQWIKLALTGLSITGLGACGTLSSLRPPPVIVQAPPPAIPAECYLQPTGRREVATPPLLPEDVRDPVERTRNERANQTLAFQYWRERATVAEEQADINGATQSTCASGLDAQAPTS